MEELHLPFSQEPVTVQTEAHRTMRKELSTDLSSLTKAIAETKLEHAKSARLWLWSVAEQLDECSQTDLADRVRELANLIVADAHEIVSDSQDSTVSLDSRSETQQSVEEYDSWIVQVVNRHLEKLTENGAPGSRNGLLLPRFSQAGLGQAFAVRQASRPIEQ